MEENYNQPPLQPQTPTPKHKLNKANIVMAILLILALAAAITFAVLWATKKTDATAENSASTDTSAQINTTEVAVTTNNDAHYDEEAKVKEVVSQVFDNLEKGVERPGFLSKTYDNQVVFYKADDMTAATELSQSYGVKYNAEDTAKAAAIIEDTLAGLGFTAYDGYAETSPTPRYISNDKQIVCRVVDSSDVEMSCGSTNWISSETKNLVNSLAKAITEVGPNLISQISEVKNSSLSPYQTISAEVGNAVGLFYRENPNAKWKLLRIFQMGPFCSWFTEGENVNDIRKAFADYTCYDADANIERKVSEL